MGGTDPAGTTDLWSLCLAGSRVLRPGEVWTAWSLAPSVVMPLAMLAAWGFLSLRQRASGGENVRLRGLAAGVGGLMLAVALVSPLCRLAAILAWAHMVQHVLLTTVAPLLLVVGLRPSPLPAGVLSRIGIGAWTALYGVAIWLWHVPMLYETALQSPALHLVMYATLIGTAVGFWGSVLPQAAPTWRRAGGSVLALLTTLVHTGMLGALLTFSPSLWYPLLTPGALAFGLSPLEDQQLAGLIMWVPMGAVYMLAALGVVGQRLSDATAVDMEAAPSADGARRGAAS